MKIWSQLITHDESFYWLINKRIRHESSIVIKFSISIIDLADTSLSFEQHLIRKKWTKDIKWNMESWIQLHKNITLYLVSRIFCWHTCIRDYVFGVFGSAFEIYIKKRYNQTVCWGTVFLQCMWTNKERPTFNWFSNDW